MMRNALLFFIFVFGFSAFANCSTVPASIRNQYASDMFQAFLTQSYGKSTVAFFQFDVAREQAKKEGESILKLIAIEQLFGWYRTYGASLKLFYKNPTGTDRIYGEYKPQYPYVCSNTVYKSEWGNNPEQARLIREFLFGAGETISGVFCAVVSGGTLGTIAVGVAIDGGCRMFSSLNSLWTQHETAMTALKHWEQTSLKAAMQ